MNNEINKFSMAEEDDYDEYEEEVIERDEEYDDEDEYDDEEYEDEEYDDEEEPYEDEEYDDYDEGYDDQYYDDRLNQVLDELAELKRNMTPAVQQSQQPFLPIQPHMMFGMPQQNNEVVMYNEISRLRDELSKTQNSQTLHEELSRLKDDMERDKRQNEAQFLSEIKRLNERIEELQSPDKPKLSAANQNAGLLPEGASPSAALPAGKDMGKLVGINENILKSTRDGNSHVLSELAEIRKKLDSMGADEDTAKLLGEIKELVSRDDRASLGEIAGKIAELKETVESSVAATAEAVASSASSDNGGSGIDQKLLNKLARMKQNSSSVDLTEVMRSVYELKGMLGSGDANQRELVNMALLAYTDLDLLHATIANSTDFRAKLEAVENFVSTVNSQDFITSDALSAYNIVLKELMDTPIDRNVFDSLCSFASATGKITISSAKKEAVNKYIAFADRAKREDVDAVVEFLPEMVSAINDAEGAKNVTLYAGILDDVMNAYAERNKASESDKFSAENEIKALVSEFTGLTVGDIVTYSPNMPLPTSDAVTFNDGDSVSDRIDVLLRSVNDLAAMVETISGGESVRPAAPAEEAEEKVEPAPVVAPVNFDGDAEGAINELRLALSALDAKLNLDGILEDINANFAELKDRLSEVDARLGDGAPAEEPETAYTEPVYTENADASADMLAEVNGTLDKISEKLETMNGETDPAVLEDLAAIKDKLAEQDMFVSQIADIRTDLLTLPETLGSAGQFDKLFDDIVGQFDKLYEDLTAVDADTSEKINAKLDEMKALVESLTQNDMTSAVVDTVVDFRNAYDENQALSAADRAKLLEDVAFVRAGIEQKLAEQAAESVHNEDLLVSLETLQTDTTNAFNELAERIAALEVSNGALSEQNTASDDAVKERFDSIALAIDELKEKSAAIEDTVNSNGILVADNQTALVDSINKILDILSPASGDDKTASVYDEVVAISDKVDAVNSVYEQYNNEIRESLADIKEQIHLKELEQSLETIPATEEEQNKLLTEISELRERLSGLESLQQTQADSVSAQLDAILSQVAAVAEIQESLGAQAETDSEIVRMQDDITFIRNQIEANIETVPEENDIDATLENENMSLLMDDIAAIKEKLAGLDSYDTVAEVLALREDVKTARLLDNGDVAAELEGLKGDLMELKADIADIKNAGGDNAAVEIPGEGAPTSDEVNMLLGEIVSLRDEIQAYKDDVNNIVSVHDDTQPVTAVADENIAVILDELTGLHNEIDNIKIENFAEQAGEIDEIKTSLSELKDMISRRTTIADESSQGDAAGSNELNVVLDEIINVKSDVEALTADFTAMRENAAAVRESDVQAEKAALADEMQSIKSELFEMIGSKLEELSFVSPDFATELQSIKDQLSDLQAVTVDGMATRSATQPAEPVEGGITLDELYGEILSLREEMTAMQANRPVAEVSEGAVTVDMTEISEQLAAIREQLANPVAAEPAAPDEAVLGEVLSLRDEVVALREQLANMPVAAEAASEPDTMVLGEILSLREELTALREQMNNTAAADESETDSAVLGEILSLREEIERMRDGASATDEHAALIENVEAIKEDVRTIKDEPDLSIINEVLALRDEFQAFKDELNKTRTAPAEDKSKDELIAEVQSLRDQLFAISMANVNDGSGSDVVYESYNNIILDEIASLRDEIALVKQSGETSALGEELAQMKDKLTNLAVDDSEMTEARFREIKEEIAALKNADKGNENAEILDELASLKEELANQREADAATLDFMSEIAKLVERQNVYISQASNERLSDEIESLKAEIASSLSVPATSEDIRSEIESLKAELGKNRTVAAPADNFAVLSEIAALRRELNSRPASVDGEKILNEIGKLKADIGVMADREPGDDGALSRSINDLKAELNQIAGFVGEEEPKPRQRKPRASSEPKPQPKKPRAKPGPKPGSKRKTTPKKPEVFEEDNGLTSESLLSKIDSTTINLGGSSADETIVLNPNFTPDEIPPTSEEMAIASRIAKQVANKLIMEQLVEQLGDGTVSQSQVEEIVKDMLPQEFTTIQVDEQTDRVRRLANSLVLDKLRSRLKK